jgi:transcriptional regulator with GAF, ATPase, and Fis domain
VALNKGGQILVRRTESAQLNQLDRRPLRPQALEGTLADDLLLHHPHGRPSCTSNQEGLAWLGSWLTAGTAGYHEVDVLDESSLDAVDAHLGRVARRLGRRLLRADVRWVDCGIRHMLQRLGETPSVWNAKEVVRQLLRGTKGAILGWVGGGSLSSFDRSCLDLLRQDPGGAQVVVISVHADRTPRIHDDVVVVGRDPSSLAHWWAEVVEEEKRDEVPLTIGRAEAVWRGASAPSRGSPSSASSRAVLSALLQSRSAWPHDALAPLASEGDGESLQLDGFATRCDGLLELSRLPDAADLPAVDISVAKAMIRAMPDDPWVAARAAALLLEAGDRLEPQRIFSDVVRDPRHEALRPDLWRLWMNAVRQMDAELGSTTALASAELAIELEEGVAAEAFSELLCRSGGVGSFEPPWVLGRTQLLRADGRAARVSLEQAVQRAPEPHLRWLARAHLAEACLVDGDLEAAESIARDVVECGIAGARLTARNVLGKLILAKGSSDAAESHFAQDELEALQHGLMRFRLRARVNRAVAMLTRSEAEGALALLEGVLQNAAGDVRARAMAHLNKGVAQHLLRNYQSALDNYDHTIELSRRSGDQIALNSAARNLAELRLTVGLVDEAWQALQFARRTTPRNTSPARLVERALVGARILLERGDTVAATVEVTEAIALSDRAALKRMAGECHRLAARIALREGDIQRAADALAPADFEDSDDFARGETALLQAKLARARGLEAEQTAQQAKAFAVRANDEELLLEVNLLLAEIALAEHNPTEARRYAQGAAEVRERFARRLRGAVRQAYLDRSNSRSVDALLHECDATQPESMAPSSQRRPSAPDIGRPFVGNHPSVLGLLAKARRVAKSDAPVLICGDSGTGKELIAELIHVASERQDGPFVAVNCAALVETLLLSELFGHERGAFTGAVTRKRGRFELADRGTLFLDEIGDISPGAQVALLRVLQTRTFTRVGGSTTLSTNARVVCATHRDLDSLVERGAFRQDLYYRLCGVPLDVPPLRERGNDVLVLAQHILDQLQADGGPARQLSNSAKRLLSRHAWPGNVRELQNVLSAAAILSDSPMIEEEDVAEHIQLSPQHDSARPSSGPINAVQSELDVVHSVYQALRHLDVPLPELKRRIEEGCIALAMDDAGGHITRAAGYLGMKRPRVSQLVKTYGLKLDEKEQ